MNKAVLVLFLIGIGGAISSLIRSWSFTLAGMSVVCRLRKMLFGAIIQQEVAFFDTNRTGELTNRLSSDTQVVQNAVTVGKKDSWNEKLKEVVFFDTNRSGELTNRLSSDTQVV